MSATIANELIRDCIELAIDGFLFRDVTPSDHYYRFSQSFPRAFLLNSNCSAILKENSSSQHNSSNAVRSHHFSSVKSTEGSNKSFVVNNQIARSGKKSVPVGLKQLEAEANDINERMKSDRLKNNRPDDLSKMTFEQIVEEKIYLQQQLLKFENEYSKPTIGEEKKIMKPLYDYYRKLKRLVAK